MSYSAKVLKVFIASPGDVLKERQIVRNVLARWNTINAEREKIVLLPVGWETDAAPDFRKSPQENINDNLLQTCDILIGLFWTKIGRASSRYASNTIEEIQQHISERKLSMIYFSCKPIPSDVDTTQLNKLRKFKKQVEKKELYGEFKDEKDLEEKLYNHIQIKIAERKFRSTFDSDIISKIKDDEKMAEEISKYIPTVAFNVLKNIIDEDRNNVVWDTITAKLSKSPADLRTALIWLTEKGAFKHKTYIDGVVILSELNQDDFAYFMSTLYSYNKYEFYDLYKKNLLKDSPFAKKIIEQIEKDK